ncbi:MAG: porin [Planctomycetota bacterium]|jgi:hypothetical protein
MSRMSLLASTCILTGMLVQQVKGQEEGIRFDASWQEGLRWSTQEYPRLLHIGGVSVLDFLSYDSRNSRDSGPRIDRAVLRVDGSLGDLDWRVAPDLKGIDTTGGLEEAWLSYSSDPRFRARLGWQEIPLTIEGAVRREDLAFASYAFPSYLDGRRDWAARFDGEFAEGLLTYDLAASVGDGSTLLGERVEGTQLSARATIYPFLGGDSEESESIFAGLFVAGSLAYTYDYEGPLRIPNAFRNQLFKVSRFEADTSNFWHLGYGWDLGPLRLTHEFMKGGYRNIDTPSGDVSLPDQTTSWTASGSWMITGEVYDSRPFRAAGQSIRTAPRRPFFGAEGRGPGAWEVAVRYSNGDIDRDFFLLGFTDFTTSSQEFRAFDASLNWYPVQNLKVAFQFIRTIADQFPDTFDSHGRDTSVSFRIQYSF